MVKYMVFINILGFIVCCFDKILAIKKKFRISEKLLIAICLIGGIFGFYLGTKLARHKTKDKKFLIMYPILLIWIFIIIYLYGKII